MTIQHSPGERLAIVVLGSSVAKNIEMLRLALRLGVRTVAIGDIGATLEAVLPESTLVERHGAGTAAPGGDGVLIFDARN